MEFKNARCAHPYGDAKKFEGKGSGDLHPGGRELVARRGEGRGREVDGEVLDLVEREEMIDSRWARGLEEERVQGDRDEQRWGGEEEASSPSFPSSRRTTS